MRELKRFDLAYYFPGHVPEFDEYLSAIQRLGASLAGTGMGLDHMRNREHIQAMVEALERRGMEIVALHSPCGLAWQNDVQRSIDTIRTVVDCAHRLGARSTVWHFRYVHMQADDDRPGGEKVYDMTHEEIDALMRQVLPEVCAYAADKGVEINVENLPFFHWSRDSYDILRFVESMNIENFGFIIDTGHSWCNEENPAEVIRRAGPLLRDTHLHDNLGSRGQDFSRPGKQSDITPAKDLHLVPGMGTINWVEVIRALWEIGYARPLAFEEPRIKHHPDESTLAQWIRCMEITQTLWRAFEEAAAFLPDPQN